MPAKNTLFFVTDIETTLKYRVAFDIAWKVIDRTGKEYARGSYVIREAFQHDVPFFKEKLGHYFDDAYNHIIKPANILEVRNIYNEQAMKFMDMGHRVIFCAYNAAFDFKYLPETLQKLTNNSTLKWLTFKADLLDIWNFWGQSVPKIYAQVAEPSNSGKYLSTSAEQAYRFETNNRTFIERHMAIHDCEVESVILTKTLARKKSLPVVNTPKEFRGSVWKDINTRLGITGDKLLAA